MPRNKIIRSAAERGDTHTGWQSGDPSPKLNRRIRRVFPTKEIPHLWAHQTQSEARNPQGNLFFDGPTLYSYRTSYPIARIFRKRNAKLVLVQEDHYSHTTAQHIHAAKRAVSNLPCIDLPEIAPDYGADTLSTTQHAANIAHLQKLAADHLAAAKRTMRVSNVEWRRKLAFDALTNCGRYLGFFGIRRKAPQIPAAEWLAAENRARAIESPDPVRDARKFKARQRRQAAARIALQASFDTYCAAVEKYNAAITAALVNMPDPAQTWRDTGRFPHVASDSSISYSIYYKLSRKWRAAGFQIPETLSTHRPVADILLRVNGDQIETSEGARIPVAHAARVWRLVLACRSTGREYTRNGHTEHAGPYPIDRVAADGTLHAGCHTIKFDELSRMAATLGLPS